MPITFSDGTTYKDDFNYVAGQPEPADDLSSDPIIKSERPKITVTPTVEGLEKPMVDDSQNVSQIDSKPRTEDLSLRERIRQGARWIQDNTGIGKESHLEDFLWKLQNSSQIMQGYFEGKIDQQDPAFIGAITQLATTAGNVGLATAPLRTGSLGTFGGLVGANKAARTAAGVVEGDLSMENLNKAATAMSRVAGDRDVANAMVERGFDKQQIFDATGLFKGKDGFWRHEIDDSGATFNKDVFDKMQTTNAFRKLVEGPEASVPLKDIFDHPELYKQYPEFQNIKVGILPEDSVKKNVYGDFGGDVVRLRPGLTEAEYKDIMIHELQHAVQAKEGFARGGNVGEFMPTELKELAKQVSEKAINFKKKVEGITKDNGALERAIIQEELLKSPNFLRLVNDEKHAWNQEWVVEARETKRVYDELHKQGFYEEAKRIYLAGSKIREAEDLAFKRYQDLYGEMEARNVQARDNLRKQLNKIMAPEVRKIIEMKLLHPESSEPKANIKEIVLKSNEFHKEK